MLFVLSKEDRSRIEFLQAADKVRHRVEVTEISTKTYDVTHTTC